MADAGDNLGEFQDPINYDLEEGPGAARRIAFYRDLAARQGGRALDLGCGTGLVALPIAAAGLHVTGVDLAPRMLAHARAKARAAGLAERTSFHDGDLRTVRVPAGASRFAFVYLTGHTFQAMLTRADQDALLRTVRHHLAPGGLFVFDTRNPGGHDLRDLPAFTDWRTVRHADGHDVTSADAQAWDPARQVMRWTIRRRWRDADGLARERTTRIDCRFTALEDVLALLRDHGLDAVRAMGDWDGSPFRPDGEEMILACRTGEDARPLASRPG